MTGGTLKRKSGIIRGQRTGQRIGIGDVVKVGCRAGGCAAA